jgi:anionic cell wall polymer biosynthesis LytR-Cps2A-Psr (LCP) family protein
VESSTGIRIDHVGMLDFPAFQSMTDALGGVTVNVPDYYENRGHVFLAGHQRVDGAAALAYVRNQNDRARSGSPLRQQRMMQALFDRISQQGALSDLGRMTRLVDSLTRSLRIDDTLDNPALVSLAWELRGVGHPTFVRVPTDDRADDLWSYLRSDSLAAHLHEFR